MNICVFCRKPKAAFHCGFCQDAVCKNCAQFINEDQFELSNAFPANLSHGVFCSPCYDQKVVPEMTTYEDILARAKNVFVFYRRVHGKETRLFSRTEAPITIENGADEEDILLKMGFKAAERGFNALVDIEVSFEKVKNGSFQTLRWKGTGIPTLIDAAKQERIKLPKNS